LVRHPRLACLTVLMLALSLGGCSVFEPKEQIRGNKVDADQMKELTVGTSTRADVTALLGSPTLHATFDDNTWLYISEVTRPRIAGTQAVEQQNVVEVTFDDKGVLRGIKTKNQDDSIPVTVVDRTTPSPGSEASFLQQLFGNVGRFTAAGIGTGTAGPSGGAPKPF
jgi:outer membrane protein assembly factor BamE (lipoprotein component of BamABCDE complex)